MTRSEAVTATIASHGGTRYDKGAGLPAFRFPSLAAADTCKAILDALLVPSGTGAVFLDGRLLVDLTFIDDQAAADEARLAARAEVVKLDAEWRQAFDALRAVGLEANADDPIAARYRAASDAVNHANRSRDFTIATGRLPR